MSYGREFINDHLYETEHGLPIPELAIPEATPEKKKGGNKKEKKKMTEIPADVIKEMNIFRRMLCVQSELGVVAKNLDVEKYKAVGERDIIDAVKPLEAKYGVYSYPASRDIVEAGTMEFQTRNGPVQNLYMRVHVVYRFVNVDKPEEFIEVDSYGDGIDKADKADGKAMTYADKYAMMKAYKISTGDDPDAINSDTYGTMERKVNTVSGDTASEPQLRYIKNLYSENEIAGMLSRLNRSSIEELTKAEAKRMIDARATKNK